MGITATLDKYNYGTVAVVFLKTLISQKYVLKYSQAK